MAISKVISGVEWVRDGCVNAQIKAIWKLYIASELNIAQITIPALYSPKQL
jgi:hypothetical protein